jgi:hypothetical protein
MSLIEGLPTELLLEVFELVASGNSQDLWGATLTSKSLHQHSNPLLYKTISINLTQTCSSVPLKVPLLLRTLLKTPELGTRTESLSFHCTGTIYSRDSLALLQRAKILAEWMLHLGRREELVLLAETMRYKSQLLGNNTALENQAETLGSTEVQGSESAEDEAFRLYGTVDGSVSQAIARRRNEVAKAALQIELDITDLDIEHEIPNETETAEMPPQTQDSDSGVESLDKEEYMEVMRQALFKAWAFQTLYVGELSRTPTKEMLLRFLPDTVLSLLPSVKTLSLDLPAAVSIPWTFCDLSHGTPTAIGLSNLTSLTVGYSIGAGVDIEDLSLFFTLPCLRAIDVHGCVDFVEWRNASRSIPFRTGLKDSPVTSLKLIQSELRLDTVKKVLEICKNLEKFEYTHKYQPRADARIQPIKLVQPLHEHCKQLVSFSCDTPDDISGCLQDLSVQRRGIGQFADLDRLISLDVYSGVLVLHPKDGTGEFESQPQLSSVLPRSLKQLILRHCHEGNSNTTSKQLLDLLVSRKYFPDLTTITLTSPSFRFLELLMVLREQFRARGIHLICEVCEPSRVSNRIT